MRERVATDLERSFGITLDPEDVEHLTTIRAVLQCIRLRRWERDAEQHEAATTATAPVPLRARFVRYTPPAPLPLPATAASFAPRKS